MQSPMIFQNQMSLGVFDTQLGAQGMESIDTPTLFGSSLAAVWSISCTGLHSYQHDSTVLLPHPQKNPKLAQPHIFQIPLWNFAPSKFPTNV
jgi:hypothetical protein